MRANHLALLLLLPGCGSRALQALPAGDGGPAGPAAAPGVEEVVPLDAGLAPDAACAIPPGYCHHDAIKNECPPGQTCEGCYACAGKAYWSCGCSEIVPCLVCSACIGKCARPPAVCPGDPGGLVCDIYMDGFLCPPGARRTVINCRPLCQNTTTCAEVPSLPAKHCGTNADCQPDQYCLKDGNCVVTGAIAGICQPRPKLSDCPIPKTCQSVCGCDGKTYCSLCEARAAGVSLATTTACLATTCAGLEAFYAAEVQKAKQCCPACNMVQCVTRLPAQLGCGCDTMVNTQTAGMKGARDEWLARGCTLSQPPCGVKCESPEPGTCLPVGSGATGACTDAGK